MKHLLHNLCKVLRTLMLLTAVSVANYANAETVFTGEGEGTAGAPYKITTEDQLKEMGNNLSAHYMLMNDLTLVENWVPIGTVDAPFNGVLDGNGKVISNVIIKIEDKDSKHYDVIVGFFTALGKEAFIKNVGLKDCQITASATNCLSVGGLAGVVVMPGGGILNPAYHETNNPNVPKYKITVENCFITGTIEATAPNPFVGGFIAGTNRNNPTKSHYSILSCYSDVAIKVLTNESTYDCYAAGIAAYDYGDPYDCFAKGDISVTSKGRVYACGIVSASYVRRMNNIALNKKITVQTDASKECWIGRIVTQANSNHTDVLGPNYAYYDMSLTKNQVKVNQVIDKMQFFGADWDGTVPDAAFWEIKDGYMNLKSIAGTFNDHTQIKISQYLPPFDITIKNSVENGKITVTNAKEKADTKVTPTITPDKGYRFKSGSLKVEGADGTAIAVGEDNSFIMPVQDVFITAEFEIAPLDLDGETSDIQVKQSKENEWSYSGDGASWYSFNDTISGTLNSSYSLKCVTTYNGKISFDEAVVTNLVLEDTLIVNSASELSYTTLSGDYPLLVRSGATVSGVNLSAVSINTVPEGAGSATVKIGEEEIFNGDKLSAGSKFRVLATPMAGTDYKLDTIYVKSGNTAIAPVSGEYTMPASDITIDSQFRLFYPVHTASSNNGTVSVDPKEAFAGDTVKLTITPSAGYYLDYVKATGAVTDTVKIDMTDSTFIMPAQAVTVSATFALDSLRLADVPECDSLLIFQKGMEYYYQAKKIAAPETKALPLDTDIPFNGILTGKLADAATLSFEPTCEAALVFDEVEAKSITVKEGASLVLESGSKLTYTEIDNQGGILVAREGAIVENTNTGEVKMNVLTITTPANGTLKVKAGNVVIISGDRIAENTTFTVTAAPNSGYKTEKVTVQATSGALSSDINGLYTMPDAEVTVSATFKSTYVPPVIPDPVNYTVSIPQVEGAKTDPVAGDYTVEEGEDFSFSLTLEAGYDQSEPVVTANGITLTRRASDGKYLILNISDDQEIIITGIVENAPTANDKIDSGTKVWAVENTLFVCLDQPCEVVVLTSAGHIACKMKLPAGENRINDLNAGLYIIRIGDEQAVKVIIR